MRYFDGGYETIIELQASVMTAEFIYELFADMALQNFSPYQRKEHSRALEEMVECLTHGTPGVLASSEEKREFFYQYALREAREENPELWAIFEKKFLARVCDVSRLITKNKNS